MATVCQQCGQPVQGLLNCPKCGAPLDNGLDEVWGLPSATPPQPPPPSPPPPTVVTTESGGYGQPGPSQQSPFSPPPPPPPASFAVPQPSGAGPRKSRTGIIIAAVVALIVVGVGVFALTRGDDDDPVASDDTEQTNEPAPSDETSADSTDDTTADTTADSTDDTTGESIGGENVDPTRDYPELVRTNFITSCADGGNEDSCRCALEEIETQFSLEEFIALEQTFTDTDTLDPRLTAIIIGCQ
jgi:hypothetical protein